MVYTQTMEDTTHIRQQLEQELARVELELTDIGVLHATKHPLADTGKPAGFGDETADYSSLADADEEQEANKVVAEGLEARMEELQLALTALDDGTYGVCITCGKQIEKERLEANRAARTCIACA